MRKFFYRVTDGDDIMSIAARFGVSAFSLVADNELIKEPSEGDVLFVYVREGTRYKITPYDSLKSISEKFSVTPFEIRSKNGNIPYVFYGTEIII